MKIFTRIFLVTIIFCFQLFAQPWYVRGDFNGWSGTAEQLVDDGTNGDVTAGDGIFSRLITIATAGRYEFKVTVDDWSVSYPASNSWIYTTTNNQVVFFTFDSNAHVDLWLPDVNIVNADDQLPPTADVVAVGDHNGWNNAGSEVMHDDGLDGDWLAGDGIYVWHTVIAAAGSYAWKATLSGTWDAWGSDNRAINSANVSYTTNSANEDVYFYFDSNTGRVITASQPLPVELISFTANISGNTVTLNWQTATELNNSGFDIERRTNNDWEKIGFVSGAGTTTEPRSYYFNDNISSLVNFNKLVYRLKQVDFNGSFEYSDEVEVIVIPAEFTLSQNYPNPFNPSTRISYSLPVKSNVTLRVFDALGSEAAVLVNKEQEAGNYVIDFDAAGFTSGVYFYRIETSNFTSTKKMLLMK